VKRVHELLYEEDEVKVPKLREALSQVWSALYQLPALLGLGQHWPLSPHEADALGQATEQLIRSIPSRRRGALTKQLMRLVPWIVFGSTVYIVTYPRVVMTQNAQHAAGAASGPVRVQQDGATAMAGVGEVPTWADIGKYARRPGGSPS
jgi:hypothetical protein